MRHDEWTLDLGASASDSGTRFRVWAPAAKSVAVQFTPGGAPGGPMRTVRMTSAEHGYFEVVVPEARPGSQYSYLLDDDRQRPDPASRLQPSGVHGPSAVVDPQTFHWTDQGWTGLRQEDLILYELHVGTATQAGTFDGLVARLPALRALGVTAIELMPVAQFPGVRNWGYDGVFLYAPQASYGGPDGLKRLVDAAHRAGLGVVLDVVYNHLGPEGNYLHDFGPYFTDRYRTPWGAAINYDGPDSDPVRHFVISNARYWVNEYHIDALRLDAIHGIYDFGAIHLLRELGEAVHADGIRLGRRVQVIAESDLNDVRVITPADRGGYGLDAQWSDDFHHALHALLTGEQTGYYADFGQLEDLAIAWQQGYVYSGRYSRHRRRRHGNAVAHRPPAQLVVFSQNHDQVGNRARGDRLTTLIPREALRVAAMAVLLAPNIPLLFMGEEYGEERPFLYFTDHGDPALQEAVRQGRRAEFAAFAWTGEVPDPQAPDTFARSRVDPLVVERAPEHAALQRWYARLIELRKQHRALGAAHGPPDGLSVQILQEARSLLVHRWSGDVPDALVLLGFGDQPREVVLAEPKGLWRRIVDASEPAFGGRGVGLPATLDLRSAQQLTLPPYAAAAYLREATG